jgi:hypothetical protein
MKQLVVALLLLTRAAVCQNLRYDNVAYGPRGPIPNALVAVCTQPANTNIQPCNPLATLCSSLSDTACTSPNPVRSDALGNYHFYVKGSVGVFTIQIYGPQVSAQYVEVDQGSSPPTVGYLNGIYNPLACAGASSPPSWCSGSDIGAWVNAAASQCASTGQCLIVIPPSPQLTITTPIVFVEHETLRCPMTSQIDSTKGSNSSSQLYYNGSGTAITMNLAGGRLEGCDILLGPSVTYGVLMGGNSNYIRDAGIRGGGTGTILAYVSGAHGGVGIGEDQHIEKSRISDFTGTGIACDNSNDTFLTDVTMYAQASNSTSIGFLADSACSGVVISNLVNGYGKYGMKIQHTLGGNYPTFMFARNYEADTMTSDCIDFDSSLGSANLDYTLLDPWAAACGANGIHISGGSGLRFTGGKIRVNRLNGFLIDSTSPVGIFIDHNLIEGNNQSNTSGDSGILVTAHFNTLSVTGNVIQNYPEVGGNQAYALSTSADIDGLIFAENFCANNVTGCANVSSVSSTKLTYFGNLNLVSGVNQQSGNMPVTALFGITQPAANTFAGKCSMSTGTTCTFTSTATFTNYVTFASIDQASTPPSTAISAKCAISGTTVTITAGASNSLTWDCVLVGNPN